MLTVQYANATSVSPRYSMRPADLVSALSGRPDFARLGFGYWVANGTLEYGTSAWAVRVQGDHATLWDLKGTLDALLVDARSA